MSNANATANDCPRCGGEGMHSYKHVAGGVCFACGRTPAGGVASPALVATARERCIMAIKNLLNRAAQEKAEGTLAEWWQDVTTDPDCCARERILTAPADVCARAVAAFARLGITI